MTNQRTETHIIRSILTLPLWAMVGFILANGLFFRSYHFSLSVSGGELAVVSLALAISIIAFYAILLRRHLVSGSVAIVLLAVLACGFIPLIGSVLQSSSIPIAVNYASEYVILTCFVLFFYWVISFRLIRPKTLILLFLAVSLYAAISMFESLVFYDRVRRLSIGGAYNFQGNSFAIASAVSFFLGLASMRRGKAVSVVYFVSMVALAVSCLLTGSKQALFVLALSIVIILLYSSQPRDGKRVLLAIPIIGLIVGVVILVVAPQAISFESLNNRFSLVQIGDSLTGRTTIWFGSMRIVDGPLSILFGSPEFYTATSSTDSDTVHPHNLLISLLLFSGLLSVLAFLGALFVTYRFVRNAIEKSKSISATDSIDVAELRGVVFLMIIMLVGTLIYSFLSGQITRLFNVFIVWGALLGVARELLQVSVSVSRSIDPTIIKKSVKLLGIPAAT